MLWIVKKEKKKSPADCVIGFVETESLQKKTKYGGGGAVTCGLWDFVIVYTSGFSWGYLSI